MNAYVPNRLRRAGEMQDVYDLIIVTCEHDPEFRAWGASALRFLNRTKPQPSPRFSSPMECYDMGERLPVELGRCPDGARAGQSLGTAMSSHSAASAVPSLSRGQS